MSKRTQKLLIIICALVLCIIIVILSVNTDGKKKKTDYTVGYILTGSTEETGWNGLQYQAVKAACDEHNMELIVKENIAENTGDCINAVSELIEAKADLIILTSYNYSEECYELIRDNPKIVFYSNASDRECDNLTSYFACMYQGRYISGIIAGMKTDTDRIGYVAAMENSEVNRGINAFTLGVRSVNPDATVYVVHTNTWSDEEKEKAAAAKLIDEAGVDVITYHQNEPYVVEIAEAAGIYSIGYHKKPENTTDKYLTTVSCDWNQIYGELIERFLKGNANATRHIWIGMEKGAVDCIDYSAEVTPDILAVVDEKKNEIIAGKEIFSGVIYDTEGNQHCGENETISDETLLKDIDWYVEGVKLYD
ncbi:MAG: BMP family ABC transporter substrate-binding protein [Lachnospiraceae bacterium]|nr:BMP family ABC transporter substrate-binding protein [Lachnospiraceae bacterium]